MKQLFTLPFLCLLALGARAQTTAPAWTWAASLDTSAPPTASSVAADAAGNTYVAGNFTQPLTLAAGTVLTSTGGSDGFVAKYGPTGMLLWSRQLTGTFNDSFQQVVVDAAGNPTLVGTASDGSQLGGTTFSSTVFGPVLVLAQLDAQGQPLYLRAVGNGSVLTPASLALDAAGNAYISGFFALDAAFGTLALSAPTTGTDVNVDQFIVKVSPQGVPLWAQQGGRTKLASAANRLFYSSLAVEPGGNAYLTWTCNAEAEGFGSLAMPAGRGDYDVVVVKYSAQGAPQWVQRAGSAGPDAAGRTALDASGRLVVPGFVAGAGTFGNQTVPAATGPTAGFLWVLDPAAGATAWARGLGGAGSATYRSVATDATGNVYAVGTLMGQAALGATALTSAGGADGVVVKYSAAGAVGWVQQTGGAGSESPVDIALDGTGRLAVAGYLSGAGQFGPVALTGQSNAVGSLFVAHLGSNTVTAARAAQAMPLALYPNPAAAAEAVTLPALPTGTRLTFTDAQGRVARQLPAAATLPLAGLAPGFYVVQATTPGGQQWTSRLVIK